MTGEPLPDPQAMLSNLESAFASYDESRMRLHEAVSTAAQGLVSLGDRLARVEADLETAKNHLAHTRTEQAAEREAASARTAKLEGELAALEEAHAKATAEAADAAESARTYSARLGEVEGTLQALTEQLQAALAERDAHGAHAAAVEAELVATRSALEQEIANLGEETERQATLQTEAETNAQTQSARIAELELTVASVTEHAEQLVMERDAQQKRAAVAEAELVTTRETLARRPGADYVAAIEKQKARAEEELAAARAEIDRMKRELSGVRTRLTKSTSSTRIPLMHDTKSVSRTELGLDPPKPDTKTLPRPATGEFKVVKSDLAKVEPVKAEAPKPEGVKSDVAKVDAAKPDTKTLPRPETKSLGPPPEKAFAQLTSQVPAKPPEKPPGALNLDELMKRAKTVKNPKP